MFRLASRIVHLDRVRCPFCHHEHDEAEEDAKESSEPAKGQARGQNA